MFLWKKIASKALGTEALGSGQQTKGKREVIEATYNDTYGLLEKDGETLKWGELYHMFKKSNFSTDVEDQDELKIFENIKKFGIFRVESNPVVFPCANTITWILKNIDVNGRYVCNTRKNPIASFKPEYLAKIYHIGKGIMKLDNKLLNEFEYIPKDLFPKWYKVEKHFKYGPKGQYY
jgi:hypothetical protein